MTMTITGPDGRNLIAFNWHDDVSDEGRLACRFAVVVAQDCNRVAVVFNQSRSCWELPGGRIESGETLERCAQRELEEEAGIIAKDYHWIGTMVIETNAKRLQGVLFHCHIQGIKAVTSSDEIQAALVWDRKQALPALHPIDAWLIRRTFEIMKNK